MMQTIEDLYRQATFIRFFESAMAELSDAGKVPGLLHLCSGAELIEASVCAQLSGPKDQVTGSHRSHGLALLMGADPVAVAGEILGLPCGLSAGRGGTQHLIAPEEGFLTSNGIVGAQVPLAAGAALTAKTLGTGGIGACFYGDGAANQGAVFETMNLAVSVGLPLLFVLENNGLAQTTSADKATGGVDFASRSHAFGLTVFKANGYELENCLSIAAEAVQFVRKSGQPALIEASVPRLTGHYHDGVDHQGSHEDPLEAVAKLLSPGAADSIRAESKQKINHVLDSIRTELEPPL